MSDRTRTYSWEDPFALRDELASRSGLELMQLMAAGELPPPPIAKTLGFRLVEAERGHALFECEPAEYHYNPIGIVHANHDRAGRHRTLPRWRPSARRHGHPP